MSQFYTSYLSLGSNLSNKLENLEDAVQAIDNSIGAVRSISSIYETPSWGFEGEDFYNICIKIETSNNSTELLRKLLALESTLGRKQKTGSDYENRCIDIDIILYERETISSEFINLPHPRAIERKFVLIPLRDIYTEKHMPFNLESLETNIVQCIDKSSILKLEKNITLKTLKQS